MPLFVNTLMLAGLVLAAVPVIIHLFFRLRRRRVQFPPLRFLQRTHTVQNARLKLRDLLLLICRIAAIACLVLAFARPYFIGQELEAGVESGAVDLVLLVDNSASMSYKPDQLSRLDVAREQALALIAQRQTGDRVGVIETTRPNDPVQRLDSVLARSEAAVKALPQRLGIDHSLPALMAACNSFQDDAANKHAHRIVVLGDFQESRWPLAELQRQAAPLIEKYRIDVNLIDLSGPTPAHVDILKPGAPAPPRVEATGTNTAVAAIDFNLKGHAPQQPAPVTVTLHRVDDKPVAVLPVKLSVLGANATAPFLTSLNMAGSGDARVTLNPSFPTAGWQVIKVEVTARDPLPADDIAYAAAPLTERPAVLVVDGAGEDEEVLEDPTRGQSYFVAQALQASVSEHGRELDVKVVPPAGLTNLALANHGGVVLCGVSSLAPAQIQSLEQYVTQGGELLLFAARVKPGTPGKLRPPEDLTALAFYNTALYQNGTGLVGLRFEKFTADSEHFILSPHAWDRNSDIFEPFTQPDAGDPLAFSLYAQMGVNEQDLQALLNAGHGAATAGAKPTTVIASISTTRPFMLDRPYGAGNVLIVLGAARPEWTNWVRKRNFLPVIRQWSHRLESTVTASTDVDADGTSKAGAQTAIAPGISRHFAGTQPTLAQLLGVLPAVPTTPAGAATPTGTARYFLQRPDPAEPFAVAPAKANPLRIENLTLQSTLDLDLPGIYYLGTATSDAASAAAPDLLPVAVSVDPTESALKAADAGAVLAALAPAAAAQTALHAITAESSEAAKQSSRVWVYLAVIVAALLFLEQLLRDGGIWNRPTPAAAASALTPPPTHAK